MKVEAAARQTQLSITAKHIILSIMKIFFCTFVTALLLVGKGFSAPLLQTDTLVEQLSKPVPATDVSKPYHKRFSIGINAGRWQQSQRSQVGPDNLTFVNVADYHFKMGAQLEYHYTEALSFYLDVNTIIIPKEENIQGISWRLGQGIRLNATGKGGIIVPYGLGVRYAWTFNRLRPFVTSTVGATYFYLGGGTVSIAIFNSTDEENIVRQQKHVLQWNVGGGFDYRFSPVFSSRLASQYWLSSPLSPPIGAVDAFQGLSFTLGLVFLMGR